MIIGVSGKSGSGKSSVSRYIAKRLGCTLLDLDLISELAVPLYCNNFQDSIVSMLGIFGELSTDSSGNVTVNGLLNGAEMLLSKEYDDLSISISEKGVNVEKSGIKRSTN